MPLFARYHAVATNAVARLKMDVRVTADGGPEEGLVLNGASEPALAEAERVALAAVEKTVDANYFVGFALDPARDTAVMEAVREFQAHAQTAAPAAAAALPVSPFVSTDRLTLCVTPLKLYCAAHVQRARDVLAAAGAQQAPFQIGLQVPPSASFLGPAPWRSRTGGCWGCRARVRRRGLDGRAPSAFQSPDVLLCPPGHGVQSHGTAHAAGHSRCARWPWSVSGAATATAKGSNRGSAVRPLSTKASAVQHLWRAWGDWAGTVPE